MKWPLVSRKRVEALEGRVLDLEAARYKAEWTDRVPVPKDGPTTYLGKGGNSAASVKPHVAINALLKALGYRLELQGEKVVAVKVKRAP